MIELTSVGLPVTHRPVFIAGKVNAQIIRPKNENTENEVTKHLHETLVTQAEAVLATFPTPQLVEDQVTGVINIDVTLTTREDEESGIQLIGVAQGVVAILQPIPEDQQFVLETPVPTTVDEEPTRPEPAGPYL